MFALRDKSYSSTLHFSSFFFLDLFFFVNAFLTGGSQLWIVVQLDHFPDDFV